MKVSDASVRVLSKRSRPVTSEREREFVQKRIHCGADPLADLPCAVTYSSSAATTYAKRRQMPFG